MPKFLIGLLFDAIVLRVFSEQAQFRKLLPLLQTPIAIAFGGWGLWIRHSILSRPFLGDPTGWDSTLRFHVWPWPLKFVAILNLPALLAGVVLSLPLGYFRTRFSEWAWTLPTLLCVSLLWYWVGRRVNGHLRAEEHTREKRKVWFLLLLFIVACAAAALTDELASVHGIWVLFGIGIWLLAGLAIPLLESRRWKRV